MSDIKHVDTIHYRLARLDRYSEEEEMDQCLVSLPSVRLLNNTYDGIGLGPLVLDDNGGATVSIVRNIRTNTYHIGIAMCSSQDRYNKELGKKLATKRAIKAANNRTKFSKLPQPAEERDSEILTDILHEIPLRFIFDDNSLPNVLYTN